MSKIKLVAIDLAKRCYQVGALDDHGKMLYNRKLSPAKFCAGDAATRADDRGYGSLRSGSLLGASIDRTGARSATRAAPTCQAFRRVHKSDAHDTLSIAEAAQRPNIHFVPVKSIAQQDLQLLGRIRERAVAQRTALINQVRGLAREYGVNFPKSRQALRDRLPDALADADNELSLIAREELAELSQQIRLLDERLTRIMQRITALASEDPAYERLRAIPGIGPTIAPALLASLGHAQQFSTARSCAARAGLVPKQTGTGGEVHLGGITKNGNCSLRVMLIHGARTVIQWAGKHDHAQSRWIKALVARPGKNKAVVALANKLMRIVWIVLTQQVEYDMRKAFRPQPI